MNTKKILGVVAVLALVAVAMVGAGAADITSVSTDENAPTSITSANELVQALNIINNTSVASATTYYIKLGNSIDASTSTTTDAPTNYLEIRNNVKFTAEDDTTLTVTGIIVGMFNAKDTKSGMKVTFDNVDIAGTGNLIQICAPTTSFTLKNLSAGPATNKEVLSVVCLEFAKYSDEECSTQTRNGADGSTVIVDNCTLTSNIPAANVTDVNADSGVISTWAPNCTVTVTNSTLSAAGIPILCASGSGDKAVSLSGYYVKTAANNGNYSIDSTCTIKPAGDKLKSTYTSDRYTYLQLDSSASADTNAVAINATENKGTTVKLNFSSTYTFSVPSEVTLKGQKDAYNIGVVSASSTAKVSDKYLHVILEAASPVTSGSDLQISGPNSAYVVYNLKTTDSDKKPTGDAYAVGKSLMDLQLFDEVSTSAKLSDTNNVAFITTNLGSATEAGDYTGTLTFKMIVDSTATY